MPGESKSKWGNAIWQVLGVLFFPVTILVIIFFVVLLWVYTEWFEEDDEKEDEYRKMERKGV